MKIKDADMAYALKHYATAATMYQDEYESTVDEERKYYLANKAGKSFELINALNPAFEWYQKAYEHKQDEASLLNLGRLALSQGQQELAQNIFSKLFQLTKDQNYTIQKGYISGLSYSEDAFSVQSHYASTPASEYSPVMFDYDYVMFASDRQEYEDQLIETYSGRSESDLYLSNLSRNSVYTFDRTINSEASEGPMCFNATYDEIYFTRCVEMQERDVYCRIYHSRKTLGEWQEPKPILFFDETINVGHPAYLESDSTLFFSAKAEGNHQLYFSRKLANGWSLPELMPNSISGPYDEKFPVVDGDTLYFSSNRFPGYGQLDIYKSYITQEGFWATPELLEPPYNSGADDFGYVRLVPEPGAERQVLISSNRKGSRGLDDIFEIIEYKIIPEETEEGEPEKDFTIYVSIKTTDKLTGQPLISDIQWSSEGKLMGNTKTDQAGRSIREAGGSGSYNYVISKSGYLNKTFELDLPQRNVLKADTTVHTNVKLEPIKIGEEIVLEDIYYDFDKWDIREDAKPSLDSLAILLQDNPTMRIELSSHTDCRGDNDYNLELSEKRARSAVQYLLTKGFDQSRIRDKGYGELRPQATCECDQCTEEEHQENRRTSFTILGV